MRKKMDIEENVRDKMLVDEIVRKTIEEDEKFVIFVDQIFYHTSTPIHFSEKRPQKVMTAPSKNKTQTVQALTGSLEQQIPLE